MIKWCVHVFRLYDFRLSNSKRIFCQKINNEAWYWDTFITRPEHDADAAANKTEIPKHNHFNHILQIYFWVVLFTIPFYLSSLFYWWSKIILAELSWAWLGKLKAVWSKINCKSPNMGGSWTHSIKVTQPNLTPSLVSGLSLPVISTPHYLFSLVSGVCGTPCRHNTLVLLLTPITTVYLTGSCFQDPSAGTLVSRKPTKKTFAEKLSTKLDKLSKLPKHQDSSSRNINKAYQEVYRDYYGNIVRGDPGGWGQYTTSPGPRRTFHNVIRRGRSAPVHSHTAQSPVSHHGLANRTWSAWDGGGGHGHHRPEQTVFSDMTGEESSYHAINSNVCMCEDFLEETYRGKKPRRKCKKCGFDRLKFDHKHHQSFRRSISEESLNAEALELVSRRRRSKKPVFYDEQDEYEDIEFVPRTDLSHNSKLIPKKSRSRSPVSSVQSTTRGSSSPVHHKRNARTQSMIVNNRNLNAKDKEMQNISIRASPMRSASSVTGKTRADNNRNIVTVNGAATKNSSIIYLSPDTSSKSSHQVHSAQEQDLDYPGKFYIS